MFKEEFIRLCTENGVAPTAVCLEIGLSNSAYTQWTEESKPRKTTLLKITNYFKLPQDYFDNLGIEPKEKDGVIIPYDNLNPKIHKITRLLENENIPDDVIDFIYKALEAYKK